MAKDALKAESRLFKVGSRWPLSCAMNSVFPSVTGRFAAGLRVAATCGEETGLNLGGCMRLPWMHARSVGPVDARLARPVVARALGRRQHTCTCTCVYDAR